MMEMIVRNIIGNSIKYTHNGGRIKVLCSIPPDNKTVVLTISDNGSGMSNFHLKDILNQDKFINQYGVRGEKGNGLGIKLVQELIKLNNGSFKILSEINEGTTVYISVPIRNT